MNTSCLAPPLCLFHHEYPSVEMVNLGFDTSGRPVLGYLGNTIEFGKWLDE